MKSPVFFIMTMILSMSSTVFAQQVATTTTTTQPVQSSTMTLPENIDPWQVSVQGGGLWSEKDHSRLHQGEAIFGRLTYDVTPNVALGAESGGLRFEDKSNGIKYGHLDGVPAMGDLVLKLPIPATGNRLVPYIYGAAGVIFWSYSKSGYSDTTGVDAKSRTHFAAKPGGGLEYYFTPHIALFIEGSYLFSEKFHLKNSPLTPPNGKLNPDSVYGGGGIKIAF